jgi:hypothetical protein
MSVLAERCLPLACNEGLRADIAHNLLALALHSRAESMCSMSTDPSREECTICTARAPEDAFTGRTHADTSPSDGPGFSAHIRLPRRANPHLNSSEGVGCHLAVRDFGLEWTCS